MSTPTAPIVRRTEVFLRPDRSRVLIRPFYPSTFGNANRALKIITRVLALSEAEVELQLVQVMAEFSERHQKLRDLFLQRYEIVRPLLVTDLEPSVTRRILIGSYFIHEYSLESAALFNPSIIPHPDQGDLPAGSLRFLLSLRATGEGHISSITFRTGVIDANHAITMTEPTRFLTEPQQVPNVAYEKPLFERKLIELDLMGDFANRVLASLGDTFTLPELTNSVSFVQRQTQGSDAQAAGTANAIVSLARSNYEVQFSDSQRYSERVIFPTSPSQSAGIEDARFVTFRHDDGTAVHYATYTAYDGKVTFPQLLETPDFLHFRFSTLNGPAVQNKGMALFPRKINGLYAMLARQDNENISLMFSEQLYFWYAAEIILKPTYPWEFVQLGNCGSPIETPAGWLVITHGVGPMRKYTIGAALLDLADPRKVIGRLREPLLSPDAHEREGYVPNVVYSCGSLIHNGQLVLPYAISDYATRFALVDLDSLLAALTANRA